MTIDTLGNHHQPAGGRGAGQFTAKVNAPPAAELLSDSPLRGATPVNPEWRQRATSAMSAVSDAIKALQNFDAPRLGVKTAEGYTSEEAAECNAYDLVCPWCGAEIGLDSVQSLDISLRWTGASSMDPSAESIAFDYDGSGDHDGVCYTTECCPGRPVSLPEGWTED